MLLLLVVLPFIATGFAWIVGRAVLAALGAASDCEAQPILVGTAAVVLITANLSFAGIATGTAAVAVVAIAAALLALSQRKTLFQSLRYSELLVLSGIVILSSAHFLLPGILHHSELTLLEAGDFWSYVSVGSWLQKIPITKPDDIHLAFNPVQYPVWNHEHNFLRLGALFLYSLYNSAASLPAPIAFSSYSAWLVALESVSLYFLLTTIFPRRNVIASGIAAALYGLSPTVTWSAYAAFLPGALGTAFMAGILALFMRWLPGALAARWPRITGPASILPMAILFAANWSAYPEIVPLLALIAGIYALIALNRKLCTKSVLMHAVLLAGAVLVTSIVLCPMGFIWGVKGLITQLAETPHGGEQFASAFNLLRTALGASLEPLIAASLVGDRFLIKCAGTVLIICAVFGVAHSVRHGRPAFVGAVAVSAAFLFWYVAHHYALERYADFPDNVALLTWNKFKAAQFVMLPTYAIGVGGFLHLVLSPGLAGWRRAISIGALGLVLAGASTVIARQDERVIQQATTIRLTPGFRSLAGLHARRLLYDLGRDDATSRYLKWAVYSFLPDTPAISTTDTPFSAPEFQRNEVLHKALLGEPFDFVLTKTPENYPGADRVGTFDPFTLLMVRSSDFLFAINTGSQKDWFVNIPRHDKYSSSTLVFNNLAASSVSVRSLKWTNTTQRADEPVLLVTLPALEGGGLVEITAQPPQQNLAPALLPHFRSGQSFDFTDGQNRSGLMSGWSASEQGGIWSEGHTAFIGFMIDGASGRSTPKQVAIHAGVFLGGTLTEQHVQVWSGNKKLAEYDLKAQPPEILIPLGEFNTGNNTVVILSFHLPDAMAPIEAHVGSDTRVLGLRLFSMHLL